MGSILCTPTPAMHPHDAANLQFLILERDLALVERGLGRRGFGPRLLDRLPGVRHQGASASLIKHLTWRTQLHAVLYPDRRGFLLAAHHELDELDPRHLISHLLRVPADYARGQREMEPELVAAGLPFVHVLTSPA